MLLCVFVGTAWAQVTLPATDKAFTVIAEGHNSGAKPGWAINNEGTAMVSFGNTAVADETQKNFAFIQYEGKVYLYSVWAKKFVNKDMALTDKLPVDDITVENVDGGKYFFKYDDGHIMNIGGSKQLVPNDWSLKDGGNQYTLTEVGSFDPAAPLSILNNSWEITYQFMYNGKHVATQTTKIAKGANYPAVNAELLPWGVVVASVPSGAPTKNETIELACSVDVSLLPFIPAANYESIEHWYYMKIRDDGPTYAYYDSTVDYIKADASAYDKKSKDMYSWAFIGNPFDGFSVVNRAAGATMVLSSPKAPTGNTNAEELARMVEPTEEYAGNLVWTVMKPTHDNAPVGSFYLQHPTESAYAINRQGFNNVNSLCYWNNRDLGSSFQIEERPMGAVAELEALIEEAEALLTSMKANEGTLMGQYSAATITTFETAINTAKALDEGAITAAHVTALQAAMDAVKVILPTTGKYYLIHSSLSKFAEHQAGKVKAAYSDGTNVNWTTANEDDKTFYWQAVATSDGGVVFQNAKDGKFMTGNKDRSGAWTVSDTYTDAAKLDMRLFAKDANDAKKHEYGVILNGWQMHCNEHSEGKGESGNVVSWNTDKANSASSWYVVEVELPVFYDVIYNFVYNGEVKFSQTSSIKPGGAYPDIVVPVIPYGVTTKATKPEDTVTKTEVINFELTVEHELPFKTATSVGNITTWYYAQMHASSDVTSYVEDNKNENNNVEWADKTVAADEIDSHLWGFVGDIWSGIKMVNKGTGRAIVSTSGDAVMGDAASATAFVPVYSNAAYRDGWFCLKYPNNADHLNANSGKISSWWDDDNGSSFFLTEYKETEVVVSAADYATLYLGQATYIPEGVEVYAVTGIEGNLATMTAVEGVLPANTGVILKNAGTYTFKTAGATGSVEGNLLRGSVEDTYVEGLAYVLANGTEGVGLYRAKLNMNAEGAEGTTHFLNNANKAYLPKPAEASARFISFDFGTETAIENIEGAENGANAVIYDLSGRRVQKAQKGVFIVNGKVVIK